MRNSSSLITLVAPGLFVTALLLIPFGRWPVSVAASFEQDAHPKRSEITNRVFEKLLSRAQSDSGPLSVIVGVDVPFVAEGFLPDEVSVDIQRQRIAQAQESLILRIPGVRPESIKRFSYIPFVAFEVDAGSVQFLQSAPDVITIEEDVAVPPALAESTRIIGAQESWQQGFSGQGQTIAVLDTGVAKNHEFLNGKVVSEACYSTPTSSATSLCPGGVRSSTEPGSAVPCAECDHGTHVSGIAAGKGTDFSGVARDANLIAIQIFRSEGNKNLCPSDAAPCLLALTSDQLAALSRVYELRSQYKIAAVNLSLGSGEFTSPCDQFTSAYKASVDNLRSVGIATIIASGNGSSRDAISFPACISSVISVGATEDGSVGTDLDTVASFSNSNGFLTLLAPGKWITSAKLGGGFSDKQGTSMAAPHVAGAWAVLKSRFPGATVDEIRSLLLRTGEPVRDFRNVITKPRIQLDAAIKAPSAGCIYDISSIVQYISRQGGSISTSVTTQPNCPWTARSLDRGFLTVLPEGALTGTQSPTVSTPANVSSQGRVGQASIAGEIVTVIQPNNASACNDRPISTGQKLTSSLTSGTCTFPVLGEPRYAHFYTFTAQAGAFVAISLKSTAFDTSVRLFGPDGTQLAEAGSESTSFNSSIPAGSGFFSLPSTGTYRIGVSTLQTRAGGSYTIAINQGPSANRCLRRVRCLY